MSFTTLKVHLGSKTGQQMTVDYRIRPTKAAQLWAQAVQWSQVHSELQDRQRFYNFSNQPSLTISDLLDQLASHLSALKNLHPEIDFPSLDPARLNISINRLHKEFVAAKIYSNSGHDPLWDQLNITLRALESALMAEENLLKNGFSNSRIVFTWKEKQYLSIPEASYQEFNVTMDFGTAYIAYAQVGRTLLEVFSSNDNEIPDEHIQPMQLITGDTMLWLGPTSGHGYGKQLTEKFARWFKAHESRFNQLGFNWGDPKLALGQIPVASLSEPLFTTREIQSYLEKLSQFDSVTQVTVH